MDLFNLPGTTALITGSTSGISNTLAAGLANAGARVVLNGRDSARLHAAAQVLRDQGADVSEAVFDVTDAKPVATAINTFEAENDAVDILVNNAGMQHRGPLEDFEADAFDHLMKTNVNSVFYVGQAVARHMIKRSKARSRN